MSRYGGYATADGHTVRTGLVYRSNKLNDLTAAAWQIEAHSGRVCSFGDQAAEHAEVPPSW